MNVIKIDVPRSNLTPKRLEKIAAAFRELGVGGSDIEIVTTTTRARLTVRSHYNGY